MAVGHLRAWESACFTTTFHRATCFATFFPQGDLFYHLFSQGDLMYFFSQDDLHHHSLAGQQGWRKF
jgi:hypothetical protein